MYHTSYSSIVYFLPQQLLHCCNQGSNKRCYTLLLLLAVPTMTMTRTLHVQ